MELTIQQIKMKLTAEQIAVLLIGACPLGRAGTCPVIPYPQRVICTKCIVAKFTLDELRVKYVGLVKEQRELIK